MAKTNKWRQQIQSRIGRGPHPAIIRPMPAQLSLRRFQHEWLVLALVAVAALGFMHAANTQDKTRLALTQALVEHGEIHIERYGEPVDRAVYGGHIYTDKAPGLSLLAVPAVVGLRGVEHLAGERTPLLWDSAPRLWALRVVLLGPFLLVLVWLVGRMSEAVAVGTGAATALATGLGTMLGPLSSVLFAHVPAACLAFASFVVIATGRSGRRSLVAGLLAGAAVLVEYDAALAVIAVAIYVMVRHGPPHLLRFCLGGLPAALVLGAYDTLAFGKPWRLSYHYIGGAFASEQAGGFFGISLPRATGLVQTLVGERGLLTVSPVLAAAAFGLFLLWKERRLEAGICALVVVAYLMLEAGYFLPYGGFSPGPRFFASALPFLLLGLPLAVKRHPRAVGVLLVVSVLLTTANALTWPAFAPDEPFTPTLPASVWSRAGLPLATGAVVAVMAALAGLFVAFSKRPSQNRGYRRT